MHAAAEVLCLTQTAVTQRLKQLEQKLKICLFIRSRRGMLLTPEGEQLHRYCQHVAEMSGTVLASMRGAGVSSGLRLTIAGPSSQMRARILPQCQSVMNIFPKLHMSFIIDDAHDLSPKLKSGEVDLVVLRPEQVTQEMESKTLSPEYYLLVCSAQWKHRSLIDILSHEKIIDFDPLDRETFSYLKAYDLFQYIQSERHFINNTESLAELIAAGFGYGVLTEEFAAPYLRSGRLHVLNKHQANLNPMSLAWYPRPETPAYFSALIRAIE